MSAPTQNRKARSRIEHFFYQLVENSPHSPELQAGRVIAGAFVDTLVTDAKRFQAESAAKKSATLVARR